MTSRRFLRWNRAGDGALKRHHSSYRASQGDFRMLIGALITFLIVILILYLINLLPIDGRAKQIARVVVIILGVISLLKYIAVF
jgi:Na+/melibiose symporter-like transporter